MRGQVVPYVGTWIEMATEAAEAMENLVVPYVGTRIEMV